MRCTRAVLFLLPALIFGAAGGPFTAAAAQPERLERISERGTLRVCIWPDYFSITYRNPRTGTLEGIDIDMAKAFADDLGVAVEFVDSSFAELVENMRNDSCDVAMHGVAVREDRALHMDFTQPHLVSGIYAVAQRDNGIIDSWDAIDTEGVVVTVQKGTYMEPVMRERLQKAELLVVEDFKGREQAVQSGRADVFMTDYPYGQRMAKLTDWAVLLAPPEPFAEQPYAYAVPKGEPGWLAAVEAFLATVKADGRLHAAAARHDLLPILAPDARQP